MQQTYFFQKCKSHQHAQNDKGKVRNCSPTLLTFMISQNQLVKKRSNEISVLFKFE
jgi:hypothetical protein